MTGRRTKNELAELNTRLGEMKNEIDVIGGQITKLQAKVAVMDRAETKETKKTLVEKIMKGIEVSYDGDDDGLREFLEVRLNTKIIKGDRQFILNATRDWLNNQHIVYLETYYLILCNINRQEAEQKEQKEAEKEQYVKLIAGHLSRKKSCAFTKTLYLELIKYN